MSNLFQFPKKSEYGKNIPKTKFYAHLKINTKLKDAFTHDIEKIIWSYKLATDTINLPAKDNVQEVQIFTIHLKTKSFNQEILEAIDSAIPSPIIFQLLFDNKIKFLARYKKQDVINKGQSYEFTKSKYLQTNWQDILDSSKYNSLPISLDLKNLYINLLIAIFSLNLNNNEQFEDYLTRQFLLQEKEAQIVKLEKLMGKEKQFNRKIEINREINLLKKDLEKLRAGES